MTTAIASRLDRAIKVAGVPIVGVSILDAADKATWTVTPADLQAQAQPIIDAFDPDDPAHKTAELQQEVEHALDTQRLASAIVWTVIDTYSAPATKAKYQAARTKVITAYKDRPWQ